MWVLTEDEVTIEIEFELLSLRNFHSSLKIKETQLFHNVQSMRLVTCQLNMQKHTRNYADNIHSPL